MKTHALVLLALTAIPAFACEGMMAVSVGGYAVTSHAALANALQASSAADQREYSTWFKQMADQGHLAFVPTGTRLCITDRKNGIARVIIKNHTAYMNIRDLKRDWQGKKQ